VLYLRTLCLLLAALCLSGSARAVSCPVLTNYNPSKAEQAFLQGHYEEAVTLYQAALIEGPDDPTLTAGLTEVLLAQQKVADADTLAHTALAKAPNSAVLLTALGEVQYRSGAPWDATATATQAMKIDPCYPRLRLLQARLLHLSSNYASAAKEVSTAYALNPHDPSIRLQWLQTLQLARRVSELDSYLSSYTGEETEGILHLRGYFAFLNQQLIEPHKACRLVSTTATTSIDFAPMMRDATHVRSYGLDVKVNDRTARLEIDTGASGLLISRSIAEHAGLKRLENQKIGGLGSQGDADGYTAYADSIKVGGLEFRNCQVRVLDKRSVLDEDGLIGMDVFQQFLVTLDYPMRKLSLGPLPHRPDDAGPATPTLETAESQGDDAPAPAVPVAAASTTADKAAHLPPAVARTLHDRYVTPEMKDWFRVYRVGHDLLVPASLNQTKPHLFILDTGAFATSVSAALARTISKVHEDDRMQVRGLSGKIDKVYYADLIDVRFANMEQKVIDAVAFENPAISRSVGVEVSGFLGATTLRQLTITIDYRDGLVHFGYDANRGYHTTSY
jgi:predicted aspartyl protease